MTATRSRFGQLVIGPPGSGKSTYCKALKNFFQATGRKVSLINLDPANDSLLHETDVDVNELITLKDVMDELELGPNGGLLYCMEFLEKNVEWLHTKLSNIQEHYFLFDCPGQIELFTHHHAVKNIAMKLQEWNFKLVAVHLVDAHLCSNPGNFISALLISLSTMVHLELPHVNVLSKVDLLEQYGKLPFGLDYYTEVLSLDYLLEHISDTPFSEKNKALKKAVVELIEDYSLVSFIPMSVQDKESIFNLIKAVDKACGYAFHTGEGGNTLSSMMSAAVGADFDFFKNLSVKEKYLASEDEMN